VTVAEIPDAPINRHPNGFLGLLDLKTGGRNPETLFRSVQPVVDMTQFYAESPSELLTAQVAITGDTGGAFFPFTAPVGGVVVPQNEVWYLHYASVTVGFTLVAGQSALGLPGRRIAGTVSGLSLGDGSQNSQNSLNTQLNQAHFLATTLPMLVQPGDELGLQLWRQVSAAVALNWTGQFLFQRLRV
jgi:hypothetical protein